MDMTYPKTALVTRLQGAEALQSQDSVQMKIVFRCHDLPLQMCAQASCARCFIVILDSYLILFSPGFHVYKRTRCS